MCTRVRSRAVVVAAALLLACAVPGSGQTRATGTVDGRVLDGLTGNPLPGAKVTVEGAAASASTDAQGRFHLARVPAGARVLVVSYVGRKEARVDLTVKDGATVSQDVTLGATPAFQESVTVTAELLADAQTRALNVQKTAPNITNVVSSDQIGSFPDPNAAETSQRIPGISIQRDQGEGRYVIVRGTEPRLNSMMINGERIPSPDPNLRQVAVDVVPSDLLQSIEVSKALTPDMDADAIGGSVNLVMKQAPDKFRLFGALAGGFNRELSSWGQNNLSVTFGRRFNDAKLGLIVSASSSQTRRGNQDMEFVYNNNYLQDLDPRYYRLERRRAGFTSALDFKPNSTSSYTVRAVYNRFIDDHENRQRLRERVGNKRIERELRDRTHIEHITSLSFNGQHVLPGAEIDYKLVGAYSDQFDPMTMTTSFRQSSVTFLPNVSPTSIDPNNIQANPQNQDITKFTFNQQLRAINFAKDRDLVANGNVRLALNTSGSTATFLKFGAKIRDKAKGRDRNENAYTTSSKLYLTNFLETGFTPPSFQGGRYDLTPFMSQAAVEQIPSLAPMTITRNHARDAEEFNGTERTIAGYFMAEVFAGPKLMVLPGLRYEYTAADYHGFNVQFTPSGAWLNTQPIGTKTNYGVPMPAFHVRYAVRPDTNFRVALTRTLARPNYYDLVPYRSQNDQDNTIALGNASLDPTKSWNVDVLAEHFFKSVGVASAGFFYKNLRDYIYVYTYQQTLNSMLYTVTQPLNGHAASVRGFELALQTQMSFLPSPLNGIGVYANYTYSDSTAEFPNHAGTSTLPGQSKHVGNLAASYEKRGFSGKVSVNFHGSYVDIVGATNMLDRYYDTHKQIDVSFSQKLSKNLRVYMDGLNLNNSPLRYFQGLPNWPLQEEHYRWWADFGVKIDF